MTRGINSVACAPYELDLEKGTAFVCDLGCSYGWGQPLPKTGHHSREIEGKKKIWPLSLPVPNLLPARSEPATPEADLGAWGRAQSRSGEGVCVVRDLRWLCHQPL